MKFLYESAEKGEITEEDIFHSEVFKNFSEKLIKDASFYKNVPMFLKSPLFNRHCLQFNKDTFNYIAVSDSNNYINISELVGKTIVSIEGAEKDNDEIIFICEDGSVYKMYHKQSCCESVYIEDVCGNTVDMIGTPILFAEDVSNTCDKEQLEENHDYYTWTWYKLATEKGWLSIRWYGTSNGCYAEDADFVQLI